jgi:hypothetical protein
VFVRAAATAHVRPVDGVAVRQCELRHAAKVPRIARAFEAMQQNEFAPDFSRGALRMDQDLNSRFGFYQLFVNRELYGIESPPCEVPEDRQQMWIANQRMEGLQPTILPALPPSG